MSTELFSGYSLFTLSIGLLHSTFYVLYLADSYNKSCPIDLLFKADIEVLCALFVSSYYYKCLLFAALIIQRYPDITPANIKKRIVTTCTDLGTRGYEYTYGYGLINCDTETAKACLHLGFMQFNMPIIVGRVMAANRASIRVLEKIGLQYQADFDFDGQLGYLYSLDKASYIASLSQE